MNTIRKFAFEILTTFTVFVRQKFHYEHLQIKLLFKFYQTFTIQSYQIWVNMVKHVPDKANAYDKPPI